MHYKKGKNNFFLQLPASPLCSSREVWLYYPDNQMLLASDANKSN